MGKITAVVSGKGGVGKSTFSMNLGYWLAEKGNKVLIIELDNGLRTLDIMADCTDVAIFTLGDVINQRCKPIEAIVPCGFQQNLHILPCSTDPDEKMTSSHIEMLCMGIAEFYNFIILDTPGGMGNGVKIATHIADDAIIVVTADPISVRDGALVSDVLHQSGKTNFKFVLNKLDVKNFSTNYYETIDDIIDTMRVQLLGIIPEDRLLIEKSGKGQPLPTLSKSARIFSAIADRVLGQSVPLLILAP